MKRKGCVLVASVLLLTPAVAVPGTPTSVQWGPDYSSEWPVQQPDLLPGGSPGRGVSITIEPYNPPITIPASGGNFSYAVTADNGNQTPESFSVWTTVTLPGGRPYGPLFGPVDFQIPALWSTNRSDISQIVPDFAPPGIYTYYAHVGVYPNQIWDSDSFTLEKLEPTVGWYAQSPNTSYNLTGIDFTDLNSGWAVSNYQEIIHTSDGGNTWYPQDDGEYYPHAYYDVAFATPQIGWVVGHAFYSGTILHTTDGGQTWTEQTSYSGGYALSGVSFVDASNGWVVGGYKDEASGTYIRSVAHTSDGGINWDNQLDQYYYHPLTDVQFVDTGNGWAVGGFGSIVHTTNGGGTWLDQVSGTTEDLQSLSFVDASTGWVVGRYGVILATDDAGATWYDQSIGTLDDYRGVHFVDQYQGWIVGVDYDALEAVILHTTDGGSNWYAQDPGPGGGNVILYDVDFAGDANGWAAGGGLYPFDGAVLHTVSGGE